METNNEAMNRTYKERQQKADEEFAKQRAKQLADSFQLAREFHNGTTSYTTAADHGTITLEQVTSMLNHPLVQRAAAEAELIETLRDVPTKTLRSLTRVLRLCEFPKE